MGWSDDAEICRFQVEAQHCCRVTWRRNSPCGLSASCSSAAQAQQLLDRPLDKDARVRRLFFLAARRPPRRDARSSSSWR